MDKVSDLELVWIPIEHGKILSILNMYATQVMAKPDSGVTFGNSCNTDLPQSNLL